jgi:agmatinase
MRGADELSYSGGVTFSKLPLMSDEAGLAGADAAIIGAPMDEAVSDRPGTRLGPRAIRLADSFGGSPPSRPNMTLGVDPFRDLAVVDFGDADVAPGDPERSHAAIRRAVGQIAAAGVVPVVLGGDHSIAHPDIAAVAEALRPEPLGLVHLDAHADTASELHGVVRSHGTPFRLLVEEGALRGEHVVQLGLRGYWPDPAEFVWARERGVRWHLMEDIRRRGIDAVIEETIAAMHGLEHVFVSVDVDVCDPAYAPGTGTPEPGGLSASDLLAGVRRLSAALPIAGIEVVEVSPPYDHAEMTALLAHRVVLEALSGIALRKLGRTPAPERP